ncbi:MAG TPA: hypothetical protein VF738_13020 [Rhodanobacter sp.]
MGFDGLSAGEVAPVHISYVCMNFVTPTIAVWNEPRKPVCQLPITCPKFRSFFAEKAGRSGFARSTFTADPRPELGRYAADVKAL